MNIYDPKTKGEVSYVYCCVFDKQKFALVQTDTDHLEESARERQINPKKCSIIKVDPEKLR